MKYKNYIVDLTCGLTLRDTEGNLVLWINSASMTSEMYANAKAGKIEEVLKMYKVMLSAQTRQLNCVLFD